MPYVTSIERLAKEEGLEEGIILNTKEMVLEVLKTRFENIPEDIALSVNSIETGEILKSLHRQAIICEGIEAFRKTLRKPANN
ncbi:MAG: hypothetical protein GY795_47805 [Desulfobacterales bacterium]|nr:hypothetical protein [Desulfobacterales bacterium]